MACFDRSDSLLNSGRFLHSVSYGANALIARVDNAGIPHAIFGSDHPGLGTAVSHGCVRLTLSNATTLYQLVKSVGMAKTKVVVSGRGPPGFRNPTMRPDSRLAFLADSFVFNGTTGGGPR